MKLSALQTLSRAFAVWLKSLRVRLAAFGVSAVARPGCRGISARHAQFALRAVEALLIVLIAFLAARFLWMPFRHAVPPERPAMAGLGAVGVQAVDGQILTTFDPFHPKRATAERDVQVDAPATTLSLKLHGVRVARSDGDESSAIILTPDNRQGTYGIGDEIMDGVRLRHIAPNGVIISRNGVSESLFFEGDEERKLQPVPERSGSEAVSPNTSMGAAAGAGQNVQVAGMGQIASAIAPLRREGRIVGYILAPNPAEALALAGLGLKPGDIVVAVNGKAADSLEVLQQITRELKPGDSIELEVDREGVRKSFEILY